MKRVLRTFVVLAGLAAVAFAVDRWIWFQSVPASSWARRCGNCQAAALWVPLEIGIMGISVLTASTIRVRWRWSDALNLAIICFGILATPFLI